MHFKAGWPILAPSKMDYEDFEVFEYMLHTQEQSQARTTAMLDVVNNAIEIEQKRLYGR